ncbi:MAG: SLATT domain-containing protein [Actinomycetota bacterium]
MAGRRSSTTCSGTGTAGSRPFRPVTITSPIGWRRTALALGIPVVILTSFVGTSLFASVNQQVGTNVKIAGGLISVVAAVLASLMTFLRFPERAEKHRVAAARYGALRREMDHVLHTDPAARHPADPFLKHLRDRLDLLGRQSPEIGEAMWARVSARFEVSEPALSPRYPWRSDGEAGSSEEIEVEL